MAQVEARDELEKSSLLVVDDEPAVLKITQRILERRGYRVTVCHSAEEALLCLQRETFDAVVSDLHMPGIGGFGLLRAVREQEPDLPVILVTGNPSPETQLAAVHAGAFQYLAKPVNHDLLDSVVSAAAQMPRRKRSGAMPHDR